MLKKHGEKSNDYNNPLIILYANKVELRLK